MNTISRLIAGLVTAAVAVVLLFFLTTVGLVIALVVGVALFVGALSMRGKTTETTVGQFRVITFGSGNNAQGDPYTPTQKEAPRKAIDDYVDLSPEDYTIVDDEKKTPKD